LGDNPNDGSGRIVGNAEVIIGRDLPGGRTFPVFQALKKRKSLQAFEKSGEVGSPG
jgi:hypothetical protein